MKTLRDLARQQPLSLVLGVVVAALAAAATTLILYNPVDIRPTCSSGLSPDMYASNRPECNHGPLPLGSIQLWQEQQQHLALIVFVVVLIGGLLVVWAVRRRWSASDA